MLSLLQSETLRRILTPLLISIAVSLVFYFSGDAYRSFGVAALDGSQKILSYLLGVGLFISLAVLAERVVRHLLFGVIIASALGAPTPRLLTQLSSVLIYMVAFGAMLSVVFKQDLTILWAASGVAGVVVGMALRELLQDIFAGLALNIDHPVRIGDSVRLHRSGDEPIEGKILEVSWRTTRILDLMNNIIVVPNSKLASATITNYSEPKEFFVTQLMVTLDASLPCERALRVLLAAALDVAPQFCPEGAPAPTAAVRAITPQGVEYQISYNSPLALRSKARNLLLQSVLTHLHGAGLQPATPKLEQRPPIAEPIGARPDSAQILRLLAAAPLFAPLPPAALQALAGALRLVDAPVGRDVTHAGEAGAAMYILFEGLLQAKRHRPGGKSGAMTTTPVRPGDLFGLTAGLLHDCHTKTVQAVTPALLGEIDDAALRTTLRAHPDAAAILSRQAATLLLAETASERGGRSDAAAQEDLAADILRTLRRSFPELFVGGGG